MSAFGFSLRYYVRGAEDTLALRELPVAFERAGGEFQQFGKHVFPKLVPLLEKEVEGQIEDEGHGPNRGHFKPLSPAYAAWKQKHYPGRPILVASGRMRKALTDGGSPFANRAYSATTLNYGTHGVTYASFHQTGTERGLPDRPPFDFGHDFAGKMNTASLAAAREAMRAARVDRFATINPAATNAALDAALDSALARDE